MTLPQATDPETGLRPVPSSWRRWLGWGLPVYWVVLAAGTHWPELSVSHDALEGFRPDKVVHFLGFGLLTFLIIHTLARCHAKPMLRHILIGGTIGMVYGWLDEWTQGFVAGRNSNIYDAITNTCGTLAAMIAVRGRAVWRWLADHPHWRARLLLLLLMTPLAYAAFSPDFNWYQYISHRQLRDWGWPAGRRFPWETIAHFVAAMLLTWLLPASRPLGGWYPKLEAAAMVGVVSVSAFVIEAIQIEVGRSQAISRTDIFWHQVGVVTALVIWVLVASMRVSRSDVAAGSRAVGSRAFVGHAVVVSLLTLVSRLTGVVRDAVMGAAFGLTGVMGAFTIGFMIPNLFRRLFGEGALTAAFIPVYAEQLKRDPVMARRLASLCIGFLLVVTGALTVVGLVLLEALHLSRDWSYSAGLALTLAKVMLPFMPMVCFVALLGGILQVHGRFGPSAAAPIIVNLVMIGATALATMGIRGSLSPPDAHRAIVLVAWSVLLAGGLQVVWQLVAMLRIESLTLRCAQAQAALKPVLWTMVPMILGLAVFQINALFDTLIAFGLAPPEDGTGMFSLFGWDIRYPIEQRGDTAALAFAQRLYQFPLGVFGIAVATAIFPALAHAAAGRLDDAGRPLAEPDRAEFAAILRSGLRLTMFIGLPAGVGLVLVRLPLTRVIFEYNRFDLEASQRVATILAGYAVAIWAYSMTHVVTRAFYAVKDARTPLRISVVMVVFNLTLNMTLIWFLGAAGLAWSTSTTAAIQTVILLLAVRRYVERPVDGSVWRGWGSSALLTVIMAGALLPVFWWYDPASLSRFESIKLLAIMVGGGGAIYLSGAWLLRSEELRWLIRRDR